MDGALVSQVCADAQRGTLAKREKNNLGYMSRVLGLMLLAPDIVEAILDGRHGPQILTLARLLEPFDLAWDDQRRELSARS
jgi:hypothetical protein